MIIMTNKPRILALDLLRAIAVILMVEGHTVHVFLHSDLRNNIFFDFWVWSRGFTAPLFMFVSGLVFTYLLVDNKFQFNRNRFTKGIKRGVFLIIVGYALRFPTFNPFRIHNISAEQIRTFLAVDALHVIGTGIIVVALFTKILFNLKFSKYLLPSYITAALLIFSAGELIQNQAVWEKLPSAVSAYFSYAYGSVFILLPWLGYIFLGAAFAVFIKLYGNKKTPQKFLLAVAILSFATAVTHDLIFGETYYSLLITRSALVLAFASFLFLLTNEKSFSIKPLITLGKNSLLIYVIHLIILYGSPISLGFYQIAPESLSLAETIIAVLLMEGIMFYIAMLKEKNSFEFNFLRTRKTYAESK